jgi:hypothetical protein
MADVANKILDANNFDEVMAARSQNNFSKSGLNLTEEIPVLRHEYNSMYNKIKNMENNMETKKLTITNF